MPNEDPLKHIEKYIGRCDMISNKNVSNEYIRMKAFKFSLKEKTLTWFRSLPERSITTWSQLHTLFTNKFFPPSKTSELRTQIQTYRIESNKTFAQTWERLSGLL